MGLRCAAVLLRHVLCCSEEVCCAARKAASRRGAGAGLVRGWAHRRVVPDEVDRLEELLVEDALEEVLLVRVRARVS